MANLDKQSTELAKIEDDARKFGVPVIRPKSCEEIVKFIEKNKPSRILEIGTAWGVSGIKMLLANDSSTLISIEHDEEYIKRAKVNFKKFKLSRRVKILKGDCLVILSKMVTTKKFIGYFDLIFLDGPKAQYAQMLDLLINLLNGGGTIIADDIQFHESENSVSKRFKTITKRLDEFIKKCKNSPFLTNFELKTIEDGLIFVQKVKNER